MERSGINLIQWVHEDETTAEVMNVKDESGIAPGEENLTPDERLRIHTARQVVTPEKAPAWWEHWVPNREGTAHLLKETGKVWRSSHTVRFEDAFLIAFGCALVLFGVVAVIKL